MVTVFVRHRFREYEKWKRIYDELAPLRKQMGVVGASVHRDLNDKEAVIVTHRFKDVNSARAFAGSQELRAAVMSAGAVSAPEIWYGEEVEHTSH